MNILLINLDSELAQEGDNFTSGAFWRHIEYAKLLSNYFIIARTPRSDKFRIRNPIKNLYIFPSRSLNKISFIYDAFCIGSQIIKENKIGLIACEGPFSAAAAGILLKQRFGIPLNVHILADIVRNPYFLSERRLSYFLNKWMLWIIRKADAVRVSTTAEAKKLASLGIDAGKVHYAPFFIDFSLFERRDGNGLRESALNGRFDKIVLCVSRLARQKGVEALIRAIPYTIKKYPKCLFLIAGAGPGERQLRRLAGNLAVSENVKFCGRVNYRDMPQYFCAADIFVSTSLYEGTCMAIQEAAIAGKPIISTPHSGARDIIKDGYSGFLVDFGDYVELSKKILYLLENADIAEDMGRRAGEFVSERFRKEDILKKHYNMWENTGRR